jgi:hypothetical protein
MVKLMRLAYAENEHARGTAAKWMDASSCPQFSAWRRVFDVRTRTTAARITGAARTGQSRGV